MKQKNNKLWIIALWGIFITILVMWSLNYLDFDLYFLLANGREIMKAGSLPLINPFITTPNVPIVLQNWLYSICLWLAYSHFHTFGLWIFQLVMIIAMFLISLKFLNFKENKNKFLMAIFVLVEMYAFTYTNIRPQIITFLLVMIQILGMEKFKKTNKAWYLIVIPLTMLAEVNFHSSYWVMHVVAILPYIVPVPKNPFINNSSMSLKQALITLAFLAVGIGLLFTNPYGIKGILYVFYTQSRKLFLYMPMSEQRELPLLYPRTFIVLSSFILVCYLCVKKKIDSVSFFFFMGFTILTLSILKWLSFYAIGLLFLLRTVYNEYNLDDFFRLDKLHPKKHISGLIIIGCIAVMTIFPSYQAGVVSLTSDRYINDQGAVTANYPYSGLKEICDYLDKNDKDATVFSICQFASYFEYRDYKVYYDARPELFIKEIAGSDEITDTVISFANVFNLKAKVFNENEENWYIDKEKCDEAFKKINVDYFAIPRDYGNIIVYLEGRDDVEKIMVSKQFTLYKRK